jgi:hypothetical protein
MTTPTNIHTPPPSTPAPLRLVITQPSTLCSSSWYFPETFRSTATLWGDLNDKYYTSCHGTPWRLHNDQWLRPDVCPENMKLVITQIMVYRHPDGAGTSPGTVAAAFCCQRWASQRRLSMTVNEEQLVYYDTAERVQKTILTTYGRLIRDDNRHS